MMELSMEERSFILKYRQVTPQGQELVLRRLREAAARAEQKQERGKNREA